MKQLITIISLLILTSCATHKNAGDVMSDRQVCKIMDDEFDKYGISLEHRISSGILKTQYTFGEEESIRERARNNVRVIKCSKDLTPLDEKEIKHISSYKYWNYRTPDHLNERELYRWSEKELLFIKFQLDNILCKEKTDFHVDKVFVMDEKHCKDTNYVENIRDIKWKMISNTPIKIKFSYDFTYNGEDYTLKCKYWRSLNKKDFRKKLMRVYPDNYTKTFGSKEARNKFDEGNKSLPFPFKEIFPISYVKVKRK